MRKRQDFLRNFWTSYPLIQSEERAGLCGRVYRIEAKGLVIRNQDKEHFVEFLDLNQCKDSGLGQSIPSQCLVPGDVVYYCFQQRAFFLLSPCRSPGKKLFDESPRAWSEFLNRIEVFFVHRGFLHLRTPFLVPCPGVDHHIDFMTVKACRTGRLWALPTSPEIHLKKYLCQGYDRIFEIKNCFRDDLPSPHHWTEFTMLEWYRGFESLSKGVEDISQLLEELVGKPLSVDQTSLSQCFKDRTSFDLKPETTKEELSEWADKLNIETHPGDQWNDLFFRIFMERVEPHLGLERPVVVFDWPARQSSLSQTKGGWSQRFELYWKGVELANAYQEVNDPDENMKIFKKERELRAEEKKPLCEFDEDFFKELFSAMPPAVGVALGLNRLFDLCCSQN